VEPDPSFPNLAPRPWWRRRAFKVIAITILSIAAFYILERQLGEYKWRAYQRGAAAKGIKLNIADYETPAIPDEENYAAIPIFRELFDSPNAAKKVIARLQLPNWPPQKKKAPVPPPMTNWQQAFVQAGWIPSTTENAAADILRAMERLEPILSEIRRASDRPKTHWPVQWSEGWDAPTPRSMSSVLHGATVAFSLRAKALLALNRPDEALAEIRYILRAAESLKDQPGHMLGGTRVWFVRNAVELSEQGLRENKWSASHLKTLSDSFGATNELASWKVSRSGERCAVNRYLDRVMTDSNSFTTLIGQLYGFGSGPFDSLLRIAPRGWVRQGQLEYNRRIDLDLERIDSAEERIDPQFDEPSYMSDLTETLPADRLARFCTISSFFSYQVFGSHVRTRQFVILASLVRYREAHGELPESLSQLVPAFLSSVPHDIMDGQPMRYRRLDNGGCILWSIGENRIDEGGAKGPDPKLPRLNAPDWVSELPN
jgi:hypothetical protein